MNARYHHGFTLLELTIALLLLALMSSLLYGTLSLSANTWDRGEAKAVQASDMRLTEEFLRQALTAQHPLRLHKVLDQPLYFQGARESLAFAAVMPGRAGGGMYYFRPSCPASAAPISRCSPTASPRFASVISAAIRIRTTSTPRPGAIAGRIRSCCR
jgi:prepilin-type N-terminal cleavage/methylation domain-containing protein